MLDVSIGARIRVFRELHGWKQGYLAARCGWSPTKQSRLEAGKLPLMVEDLVSLAQVLEVAPGLLLAPDPEGVTVAPGHGLQIPIPQGDHTLSLRVTLRAGLLEIRLEPRA